MVLLEQWVWKCKKEGKKNGWIWHTRNKGRDGKCLMTHSEIENMSRKSKDNKWMFVVDFGFGKTYIGLDFKFIQENLEELFEGEESVLENAHKIHKLSIRLDEKVLDSNIKEFAYSSYVFVIDDRLVCFLREDDFTAYWGDEF